MTRSMGDRRSFRIVSNSFGIDTSSSRYVSEHPLDAGKKAGRQLFRAADAKRASSKSNNTVYVELDEITKTQKVAHSKERYYYKVTRKSIPVAERKEKKFGKITFTPEFTYEIEAVKKEDFVADHRG